MKRVAAGAHLPTSRLFEPAKRPDDRDEYCLDCSFLPQLKHQVLIVFTLEWSGARPNEHSQRTGPPSNADQFPCLRERPDAQASFEPGTFRFRDLRSAAAPQLSSILTWQQL